MPRLARLDASGVLHNVMGRGIERRDIFSSDEDRNDFITRLATLAQQGGLDVYAWALLPNHFHLLVKTRTGSRRHAVVKAREVLSWVAVRELGYSGAEVARYLGVTTSCINRSISSVKKPDVEDLIESL